MKTTTTVKTCVSGKAFYFIELGKIQQRCLVSEEHMQN